MRSIFIEKSMLRTCTAVLASSQAVTGNYTVRFFVLFLEFSLKALHFQKVFPVIVERREQVPFSMCIENGELIHEYSPEHWRVGTVNENEAKNKR